MAFDRFDYASNLRQAGTYGALLSAFWPPSSAYEVHELDLAPSTPHPAAELCGALAELGDLVQNEWVASKSASAPSEMTFRQPAAIADTMRRAARHLRLDEDRRIVRLRADCIEHGHTEARLAEIARGEEEVAIVCGHISTWYGKEVRGRPTAFACRRSSLPLALAQAGADVSRLAEYFDLLHKALRIQSIPAFVPTELFFMAGEGNLHPKHIACFLPEDEGVKRSPHKKTYYFANTHAALLEHASWPLFEALVDGGAARASAGHEIVPVAGVLAHEIGHCVQRAETKYQALNKADRWVSVVLQETAADVFGTLILAEVWAERLGATSGQAVCYYIAECLRYVSRGLGSFPDSDGMLLQLNYLMSVGALGARQAPEFALVLDPELVLAGLRSLARVLADTLLDNDVDRALALHRRFGPPGADRMRPLIARLARLDPVSIEYVQPRISLRDRVGAVGASH